MGIENGTTLFAPRRPSAKPQTVDQLLIDMNYVIHTAIEQYFKGMKNLTPAEEPGAYECTNKKRFLRDIGQIPEKVLQVIICLLREYSPTQARLFWDGLPPLGKILQQRIRRINSQRVYYGEELLFSRSLIMPDTQLMIDIVEIIAGGLGEFNMDIYVSDFAVAGEGEHKIMRHLEALALRSKTRAQVVVVGNDNDFYILLGLMQTAHPEKLSLTYCVPTYDGIAMKTRISSIELMVTEILRNYKLTIDGTADERAKLFADFVVLTLFLGNDFLPPLSFAIGLDGPSAIQVMRRLCYAYNHGRHGSLRDTILAMVGDSMSSKEIASLIANMETPEQLIAKIAEDRSIKVPARKAIKLAENLVDRSTMELNIPAIVSMLEELVGTPRSVFSTDMKVDFMRYLMVGFDPIEHNRSTSDKYASTMKEWSINYVRTFRWVLRYYSVHTHIHDGAVKNNYYYNCPLAPPLKMLVEAFGEKPPPLDDIKIKRHALALMIVPTVDVVLEDFDVVRKYHQAMQGEDPLLVDNEEEPYEPTIYVPDMHLTAPLMLDDRPYLPLCDVANLVQSANEFIEDLPRLGIVLKKYRKKDKIQSCNPTISAGRVARSIHVSKIDIRSTNRK